jgi:hypothetical protein
MSNQTEPLQDLAGSRLRPAERPDPLDRYIQADRLVLFALAGVWALLTHRDWLRVIDTVIAVGALVSWFPGAIRTKRLL